MLFQGLEKQFWNSILFQYFQYRVGTLDIWTSETTILWNKQTQRHFRSVLSSSKKHSISCQCMLANCGANAHRPLWSSYVLRIRMPTELYITYPEMWVFAYTRLAIASGPLMPFWETICINYVCDVRLHPTFSFDYFKCVMLFTNLHSSIIQCSCMMVTKCSSCWWIVSVFASHLYCFCIVKKCVGNVYTWSIQM